MTSLAVAEALPAVRPAVRRMRWPALLLAPAIAALVLLLILPGTLLVVQSLVDKALPAVGQWSLVHYTELLHLAYLRFFGDTLKLSLIATVFGVVIGYPIAYLIARTPSQSVRAFWIMFLFAMLFVSVLVRVYSLALSFGPAGMVRPLIIALHLNPNSRLLAQVQVVAGLMQYVIPISALVLIGTVQNIDTKLFDGALSLGARPWRAHLEITLPLSREGILSAVLLGFTFCFSSFVIPLILGQGRVQFIANLVYSRFSELADYGSGAAISVILAFVCFAIVFVATWLGRSRRAS